MTILAIDGCQLLLQGCVWPIRASTWRTSRRPTRKCGKIFHFIFRCRCTWRSKRPEIWGIKMRQTTKAVSTKMRRRINQPYSFSSHQNVVDAQRRKKKYEISWNDELAAPHNDQSFLWQDLKVTSPEQKWKWGAREVEESLLWVEFMMTNHTGCISLTFLQCVF